MKRCLAILLTLALLILSACGTGQAPAPEPESEPSSVSEPAPEPASSEPSPAEPVPETSSVPEECSLPIQTEEDPDKNPDTSLQEDDFQMYWRAMELYWELEEPFETQLSLDSYSYYCVTHTTEEITLTVGVIDEAAVDAFLTSWAGGKWHRLEKVPGGVSRARQVEFVERARAMAMDWSQVLFSVESSPGTIVKDLGEQNRIFCFVTILDGAPAGEAANWQQMPRQLKDLAEEIGIPDDMIVYHPPRSEGGDPEPGVNYDA